MLATLKMSAASALRARVARLRGKSWVPHPRTLLFIEPVTHCNLQCSFCTSRFELRPHAVMSLETFRDYAGQAIAMGFADLALTPINGDVFMDKGIFDKLRLLEDWPGGHGVLIYTNLIGAPPGALDDVLAMRRLKQFQVSVYGHDFATFGRITGRGEGQFRRLLDNLAAAERIVATRGRPHGLSICLRTEHNWRLDGSCDGELQAQLRRLQALGVPVTAHSTLDDWGGLIGEGDLGGLDMTLIRGRWLAKTGPCILPFYNVQVLADGRVNACACRDIKGDLVIGDLRRQPLAEVLSAANPAYRALIERQRAGDFPDSCRGCSFYRSIHDPRIADASPLGAMELEDFLRS